MIIAGQVVNGLTQLITHSGERVDAALKPKKIYVGVRMDQFSARRIWVDEALTDAERILFLKTIFSRRSFYTIDYEIIARDNGRVLLHAFALHEKLKGRRIAAVETVLHGLGRAILHLYACAMAYQCVCLYPHHLLLTVHRNECLYYFVEEAFKSNSDITRALRRALERFDASQPIRVEHCFFADFAQGPGLIIDPLLEAVAIPTTWIEPASLHGLVAYGLACRGLIGD